MSDDRLSLLKDFSLIRGKLLRMQDELADFYGIVESFHSKLIHNPYNELLDELHEAKSRVQDCWGSVDGIVDELIDELEMEDDS